MQIVYDVFKYLKQIVQIRAYYLRNIPTIIIIKIDPKSGQGDLQFRTSKFKGLKLYIDYFKDIKYVKNIYLFIV